MSLTSSPSEKAHARRRWSEQRAKEYLEEKGYKVLYDHGGKASNLPFDIIGERNGKIDVFDVKSEEAFYRVLKADAFVEDALHKKPDSINFAVVLEDGDVRIFSLKEDP